MTTPIHPSGTPSPYDDERLPCGRLLSGVWANWEEGVIDAHRDTCPHCQDAVRELEHLETTTGQLRDETDAPGTYDATSLTERVMDAVRLELRPGRPLPLGEPGENMWIMESVAARALRAAAEEVPGVRAGSCRITAEPSTGTGRVTVRLGVQAPLSAPDLTVLADQVRRHVEQAADRHLGLDLAGIDVHITDLADPPGGTEKGSGR